MVLRQPVMRMVVPVLMLMLVAMTAFTPAGGVRAQATPTGDRFTAEEVTAATGTKAVTPVYAVPKTLKDDYVLAFLNPGQSVPFFHSWSEGMNAAADFYGVELIETDLQLKFEETVNQFETILVRDP